MTDYLITTQEEHTCEKCGKTIEVGARAIKAPPTKISVKLRYFHENCRNERGKRK